MPTIAPPARGQPNEPGAVELSGGNVANAARVVAALRDGFRACYQAALGEQRGVAGSIRLRMRVAADGSVSDVEGDRSGLPQSLVDCVFSRAHRAKFEPPAGGHAVIVVPLKFVEQ